MKTVLALFALAAVAPGAQIQNYSWPIQRYVNGPLMTLAAGSDVTSVPDDGSTTFTLPRIGPFLIDWVTDPVVPVNWGVGIRILLEGTPLQAEQSLSLEWRAMVQGATRVVEIDVPSQFLYVPTLDRTLVVSGWARTAVPATVQTFSLNLENLHVADIPEPRTWLTLASGLGFLMMAARRRLRRN